MFTRWNCIWCDTHTSDLIIKLVSHYIESDLVNTHISFFCCIFTGDFWKLSPQITLLLQDTNYHLTIQGNFHTRESIQHDLFGQSSSNNPPCTHCPCWLQSPGHIASRIRLTKSRGRLAFLINSSLHCSFIASRAESAQVVFLVIFISSTHVVMSWAKLTPGTCEHSCPTL